MGVFLVLTWFLWGRHLRYNPEKADALMALRGADAITDRPLLVRLIVVLVLVLTGFVTHSLHHIEPSLIALLGAGAAVLVSRMDHAVYLDDVEWETLVFFAGLFIMVGSLVDQGIIGELATSVTSAVGDRHLVAAQGILVGSAALSGLVDNIPYVATMSPLVLDLVGRAGSLTPPQESLWWALALGADLGGNATAVGASANVVITGIAKRNGHPISFWMFTKYGLIVTAVTIAVSVPYIVLRYFTFA
jgi:Na+/H+ antiporter NhaD/arsenite permease-like protein